MDGDQINALRVFLDYGAVGLAGLMLVLVVIALISTDVTAGKERLLKQLMVIGAVCFGIASASQVFLETRPAPGPTEHALALEVVPHDSGSAHMFPEPIIKMGGVTIDRSQPLLISADATLIVDLFDGVEFLKTKERQIEEAGAEFAEAEAIIDRQNGSLREVQALTSDVLRELTELQSVSFEAPDAATQLDEIVGDLSLINRGIAESIVVAP